MKLELVEGDITEQQVDVIVNAANSSLLGGGGVDGAIHRKGGPAILEACRALRASHYGRGLATGQAVATTAGNLQATWVVHTVGPVWRPNEDRSALLRDCYENSLKVADELGAKTIAFPLISAGIFGWPPDDAVRQAAGVIQAFDPVNLTEARLVLFGQSVYEMALAQLSEIHVSAQVRRWWLRRGLCSGSSHAGGMNSGRPSLAMRTDHSSSCT